MDITNPNDQQTVTRKEANARRQREFRARKRAEMGEAAYLESIARYKRDLRARKNASQQEPASDEVEENIEPRNEIPEAPRPTTRSQNQAGSIVTTTKPVDRPQLPPDNNCGNVISMIEDKATKSGKQFSKSTVKTQVNRVSNLFKSMTGKKFDCKNYDWTRDTGKVLDFIENHPNWDSKDRSKQNSRNAYRTALASVLRDMPGFEREQMTYSLYASNIYSKKISHDVAEGKLSKAQEKNYVPFEKLLASRRHYDEGTQNHAIVSIYTDTPPRRALDYQVMKVIKKRNKSVTQKYIESLKKDKDFNYVILDNKNRPIEFIFNNFKTVRSIGTQVLPIPVELSKSLQRYIAVNQINNGDLLFSTSKGKQYSNFGEAVKKAFKGATDKSVTVNLIRHAYITYYLKSKRTVNERRQLAKLMGHDVNTQSLYEVIDEKE